MIKLARFSVFTIEGHVYDVVIPWDYMDTVTREVAEHEPEVTTFKEALVHILDDLGITDPVIEVDEVFFRDSIDEDMTQDGVKAIVLGAEPPEDAEWIETLDDL